MSRQLVRRGGGGAGKIHMAIGEQDLVRQCMIAPHKASEVQCKDAHHRSPVQGQGSMSTNLDTTRPQRPFLYFGPMVGPSRPGIRQRQAQIAPLDMPQNGQGPQPASQMGSPLPSVERRVSTPKASRASKPQCTVSPGLWATHSYCFMQTRQPMQ